MKKEKFLVSVIVPCFNQGAYIEETLKSISRQTFVDFETIIVNDGSTDKKTIEIINKISQELDPRVKITNQENGGLAAARNVGIRAASGKYILPLDADDTIEPTMLEKCYWALETNTGKHFAYTGVRFFGSFDAISEFHPYYFDDLLYENYLTASCVFPKKLWEEVGGYSEFMKRGYEDWEFWIKAGENGYGGLEVKEHLFCYRQHETSMRKNAQKVHKEIVNEIRTLHKRTYFLARVRFLKGRVFKRLKRMVKNILGVRASGTYKHYYWLCHTFELGNARIWSQHPGEFLKIIMPNRLSLFVGRLFPSASLSVDYYKDRLLVKKFLVNTGLANFPLEVDKNDSRIKVLILHSHLEVGGAEKVLLELLNQSNKGQFSYHVLTTEPSRSPWRKQFTECADSVYELPNFLSQGDYLTFILNFIKNRSIDVVLVSSSEVGYDSLEYIKKYRPGVKTLDLLHLEAPGEINDYFRYASNVKEYLDKRIVITEYLKNAQVEKYGEEKSRVQVIHNGVDTKERFSPKNSDILYKELGVSKNKKIVLFVGRFTDQKQPMQILETALSLKERKDIHFVLVGEGSLQPVMEEYIRKNVIENVSILPSRTDVPQVMESATLLFFPSKREGLPMVGIEAMALGKAVVASRVEGWTDLITGGKDGILVDYLDIKGYKEAIVRMVDDNKLREGIELEARKTATGKYDIVDTCRQYEAIFEALVKEKR